MPEIREVPRITPASLEEEKLVFGYEALKQQYALSLVTNTFFLYENFRQLNHDPRWTQADALYYGYMPQKVWEGTTTPRSSLGVPLIFDQVEGALPAIAQAVFGTDSWFQVEPDLGAQIAEARDVQGHLTYLLDHDKDSFGLTARNDLILAMKSVLLYGQGGVSVEWDTQKNRPAISWVDIRDFYIDPATTLPSVDFARSVIRRKLMTVEELAQLRADKRMSIPDNAQLYGMAGKTPGVAADNTKRTQEALRGVQYTPGTSDYPALPASKTIEVLIYYSKDRIVWVLNREWVAYSETNPYGCVPFCFAPCYIVPGRFYAMGIADVQEGNQRTIEALLNARLDEVHLAVHPPRKQKRGAVLTPSQQRWKPGAVFQVDDVKSMDIMLPTAATQNVYTEIQYLEMLAEKRTGVNSLGLGVPRPGNANRTLGGMQMQAQGGASRLQMVVQHIEDYLIVPMLYKMYKLVQYHTYPGQQLPATNEGKQTQANATSFHSPVRFTMLASSRMMTRDKLSQVTPFLIQFLTQGPLVAQLSKVGKTVDFEELFRMIQDATGVGKAYQLVRPMSPEEQQANQAPPPEVMMRQQEKQAELQTRIQISDKKAQTELQKAQIMKAPDQGEMMKVQAEKERSQAKLFSEQMLQKIKIEAEREKARLKLSEKQADMQMKAAEGQQQMRLRTADMQNQMQMKAAETQMNSQLGAVQKTQEHQMTLRQMEERMKVEAKREKMLRRARPGVAREKKKAA